MSKYFYGPKSALERKPPHGAPCNGCGLCCMAMPCELSRRIFNIERGPCPALRKVKPHVYACGLTMHESVPVAMQEAARVIIRAGQGCDARFNGEQVNHEFDARLDKQDIIDHQKITDAKKLWTESLNKGPRP
jgi:hypothetical protein